MLDIRERPSSNPKRRRGKYHPPRTHHSACALIVSVSVIVVCRAFSLLFYSPVTKAHEFAVDLLSSFDLVIQPVGTAALPGGGDESTYFATFSDPVSKVFYSLKFTTANDCFAFARHIAMVKDSIMTTAYKKGGARKMVVQDLMIGSNDSAPCEAGDMVSVKYELFLPSDTHPQNVGSKLGSGDLKKFVIGNTNASSGLEEVLSYQGIVGMRKKGRRFLVIPPDLTAASQWGPHVPAGSTLIVEVVLSSNRGRRIELGAKANAGPAKPAHSVQPAPPIGNQSAASAKEAADRQSILPNLSGVTVGSASGKQSKSDSKSKSRAMSNASDEPEDGDGEDGAFADDRNTRKTADAEDDAGDEGEDDGADTIPSGPFAASKGQSSADAAAAATTSAAARLQAAAAVHRDEEDGEDGSDPEPEPAKPVSKPPAQKKSAAANTTAPAPVAASAAAKKKGPAPSAAETEEDPKLVAKKPTAAASTKKAAPAGAAAAEAAGESSGAGAGAQLTRQDSIRERMARIAHGARAPGAPVGVTVVTATPVPIASPAGDASTGSEEDEIAKLLADCNLSTYLPAFQREHVTMQGTIQPLPPLPLGGWWVVGAHQILYLCVRICRFVIVC